MALLFAHFKDYVIVYIVHIYSVQNLLKMIKLCHYLSMYLEIHYYFWCSFKCKLNQPNNKLLLYTCTYLTTGRPSLLPVIGHPGSSISVWKLDPNSLSFPLKGLLPYDKVCLTVLLITLKFSFL